jgi:hypothetical protein
MGDVVEHELKVGDLILRMRCNPEVSIPRGDQVMIKPPERGGFDARYATRHVTRRNGGWRWSLSNANR